MTIRTPTVTPCEFAPVRLGLIGCGGMGLRHARAVIEMQASGFRPVEIVAVCDADAGRREVVAATIERATGHRPTTHADAADLLGREAVEAVDIVLPTALHHEMAVTALEAGKHVQVEKPLALTVAACNRIAAAAARAGRVVSVAENYRRIASNRAVGHLIRSGALGRLETMLVTSIAPREIDILVGGQRVAPPAWYRDRQLAGGYLVLEMGVHEVDLQRSWFGEIESVSAEVRTFGEAADATVTEDFLHASFRFANGFGSHLTFCSSIAGVDIAERRLIGETVLAESRCWHAWQDGSIRHRDGRSEPLETLVAACLAGLDAGERQRLLPAGAWDASAPRSLWGQPLTYGVGLALHDFARAVRTATPPEIGVEEGRAAVAVCCAMRESALRGAPVRVADVLAGTIVDAQLPLDRAIGLAPASV